MLTRFALFIVLLLFPFLSIPLWSSANGEKDVTPPVIAIWYGERQEFGKPALAQRWVNVLGNVADPESEVLRLAYRLNGGPSRILSWGPDGRRLLNPGDFNVELDPRSLREGENHLWIEAVTAAGLKQAADVTVVYHPPQGELALPYTIDWSKVENAQDVLQIVDGKWRWDGSGIRIVEIGYDRFLTFGDARWTNYEVIVPITVHGIDEAGFTDRHSGRQASIAVDLRWQGHSNTPRRCPQPRCGWDPSGSFNKFFFRPDGADYLAIKLFEKEKDYPKIPYSFHKGDTYVFRVSVQTTPEGNLYRMKVWDRDLGSEPPGWMFERAVVDDQNGFLDPAHGGFSVVAHYMDLTVGNIQVNPVP